MSGQTNYIWKPSGARVVAIDSFVPVPRGANAVAPAPLSWPIKDPRDVLDYQLDISQAVLGNQGDIIANIAVSTTPSAPGDLIVRSVSVDGASAVLWLSGGQAGTVYTVTLLISTVNQRVLQRSVLLPVLDLSAPAVPMNAILTSAGVVLTDQNGNPVLAAP